MCDEHMVQRASDTGTTIGIDNIKARRLTLPLDSHPTLKVGGCVPFYFCPRSVMLYLLRMGNHPEIDYTGGQTPIIHLEADLYRVIEWAHVAKKRWAFTSSNASSHYFQDYSDLAHLDKLDWDAISADQWSGPKKEGKQAEFLVEHCFPLSLISRIGTHSLTVADQVKATIRGSMVSPYVAIMRNWYY